VRRDHRLEPGERGRRGPLIEDDQVTVQPLLRKGRADRGLGIGDAVEAEDNDIGVVFPHGRRAPGEMAGHAIGAIARSER
jgi:hypothetical protein